jgi:hypothetical protein
MMNNHYSVNKQSEASLAEANDNVLLNTIEENETTNEQLLTESLKHTDESKEYNEGLAIER